MTAGAAWSARPPSWLLVGGIGLASLTEAVASTVLSLGRGDIMGDIYATPDDFARLDVAYVALKLVAFALTPWLLTRVPPRRALLAATLVMGVACGLAAGTTQLDVLTVLRAVQGVAGAVLLISGQAILFWAYPRRWQPGIQAVFAMGSVVAPATIAPALQGWLLDSQSWTWIFFSVLPLSLAAAGLMLLADDDPSFHDESRPFDGVGFGLLAVALSSATYVLTQGSRWDWFESRDIGWLSTAGVAALALFVLHQWASATRLFDLAIFNVADFNFAFVVSFVAGAALFGSAFLIPAFAVSILHFTPTAAGQLLLPSGALFAASLLLAAFLMQSRGLPPIATVPFGILMIMASMWMLSGSSGESGADDMMPAILIRGFGLGFLFLSITLIAFGRLRAASLASGIAIFNIGRQLGGLIGVAGLQTIIDQQAAADQTILGAALSPGSSALADRLASTSALLIARGLDAGAAAKTAVGILGGVVRGEATVLAFDSAFNLVALLFVVAAPVLIAVKIILARSSTAVSRSVEAALPAAI
jgi:MFS transporter, DHA2 family, multidrug resistance protein